MNEPVASMKDIYFSFGNKTVLKDISLQISRGSFIGLVGPNGGGKTTLVKLLLGLEKPQQGKIELFQTPIEKFRDWNKIGFVSQKANTFNRGFPASVEEVVSMGLTAKVGYFRFVNKKHKQKIRQAVDQVGMGDYFGQNIGNLSGGQQQRVFIARALVSEPELLILDEPTVGVDAEHVQKFYELLHQLNQKNGITLLLVTHDTGTMTDHATGIVCLNKTLHFHGDPSDFTALSNQDLSYYYGHSLNQITHNH